MAAAGISILYELRDGPWGGGNQFLKALRAVIEERGRYEPDAERAQVVIVNSHHHLAAAARLKQRDPSKAIVHRVAGPLVLSRPAEGRLDRVIVRFNRAFASGTVFQSRWAQGAWAGAGLRPSASAIVHNAPDPAIFHPPSEPPAPPAGRKARLIATSWSPNPRKGFGFYADLDVRLDWDRYEMTFVGNSPVEFRNIRVLPPMPSGELADELRRHHVFVTASRIEACPNALLEGMHCGLPALAIHDGAHPELVQGGGETFDAIDDALPKLDGIVARYDDYRAGIALPSIGEVADDYIAFADRMSDAAHAPTGALGARIASAGLDSPIGLRLLRLSELASRGRFP